MPENTCASCALYGQQDCPHHDAAKWWPARSCYVPPFLMVENKEAALQALANERATGEELVDEWSLIAEAFGDRVLRFIRSDRNADYGRPRDNHEATAAYWRIALKRRYGIDVPLDGLDVCQFNRLQKESRLGQTPTHTDSLDDIAGWAGNALDCVGGAE